MGVRVGVANFFLGQSIGIDENNTFQLSSIKTVGATAGRFVGVRVGVALC